MNIIEKTILGIDNLQRKRKPLAFGFAVVKKYSDDQAGYRAALVTYYGFLSLFPLLLILTTIATIIGSRDPELGRDIVNSVYNYFPVIGKTLEQSVSGGSKSGIALIIGLLLSFYGARGIADAFRNSVNDIWHIPLAKRAGFPRNLLRNAGLIVGGGGGFILASAVSGWASQVGRGAHFQVASFIINMAILYCVFMLIFRLSLPLGIARSRFRLSAIICATGLAVLQLAGVLILRGITPTSYSALFATTIGLIAWIYLQAQVIMYATEVATVRDMKLWPRSLSGKNLTNADKTVNERREH